MGFGIRKKFRSEGGRSMIEVMATGEKKGVGVEIVKHLAVDRQNHRYRKFHRRNI